MPEITYTGHTAIPSDYECADGQLALSLNLVPENGSLQPIFPASLIFHLPDGYKVAYIHKATGYTHYIITKADDSVNNDGNPDIYYLDSEKIPESKQVQIDDLVLLGDIDGTTIKSIQAVGNTLLIVTEAATNYYLWKIDEDSTEPYYTYLGTHLPELSISFGLQGTDIMEWERGKSFSSEYQGKTLTTHYKFDVSLEDEIPQGELYTTFSDANKTRVTEQVLARVNKFVADHSTNAGKFMFPFFVRYAYRLYDDSLTMHSAPILMVTSSQTQPYVFVVGTHSDDNKVDTLHCTLFGIKHSLDYLIEDFANKSEELLKWKDIITSIDFFVSAPIYSYDQSGECERIISLSDLTNHYSLCRPLGNEQDVILDNNEEDVRTQEYDVEEYVRWNLMDSYMLISYDAIEEYLFPTAYIELPQKGSDALKDEIKDCSNFYLLDSVKVEEIPSERTAFEVAEDYLQSLVNREVMTDDYDSHDTLVPEYTGEYNSRLVLANLTKKLYDGYSAGSMFCYTDGSAIISVDSGTGEGHIDSTKNAETVSVYFYIKQDNKIIITQGGEGSLSLLYPRTDFFGNSGSGMYLYLYYPNTNAYKAVIVGNGWQREVSMTPHDFLNGAFYFDGWTNPQTESSIPTTTNDNTIEIPNKIYLSEINNPFFFPVENIVTVGTGKILGIATAAKALSQGQFGQFPLYAFCDDGVWALEVSTTGTFSAVQPITRDVCINQKAITQLDSSVLFPTDRGIMEISGSQTGCITDILNGDNYLDTTTLPRYNELLKLSGLAGENGVTLRPLYDLLSTCIIVYDYTNQRIYVCDDEHNIAYVLSKKSSAWGMAVVDIQSTVNSYPEAYAMTSDGDFVDFSHPDISEAQDCFLITRPLKLDDPNALKTARGAIQRGFFKRHHVQSVLYGSRDLMDWQYLLSSRSHEMRSFSGTPYKYFRLVAIAQLEYGESIFGASFIAITRFKNKVR